MRLLVTGGAGFVGSNFVRYVLREHPDWRVANLDRLTYAGNLANLHDVEHDPRYTFIRGDIADRGLVNALFRDVGFDVVVNFAAESHVDRSILDPSPFVDTNVRGTQTLLEASRHHGTRFIQVSTDEVYGSLGPDDPPFTEESRLAPNSPYAASKAAADMMVRAYHRTYGLPAIVTRCSNNYGPFQFPEKLIPLAITNALDDLPVPVYGDGMNVRDWAHVEDHCRAIDLVIQGGRAGEVYNVGGACEMRNLDVVGAVLDILGKPRSLVMLVEDRPGHDRRYAVNAAKLAREVGWSPRRRLTEALPEVVDWYRHNQAWWRRLKGRDGDAKEVDHRRDHGSEG